MAKRKKGMHIGPRELFIMLESLALSMDVLKGGRSYHDIPREVLLQHNEAHDLFLKLEEVWDALPERDLESASEPFDVRKMR